MNTQPSSPAPNPAAGRGYLWLALVVFLLSLAAAVAQYSLKHLVVPWYLPALTTLAVILVIASLARRCSVTRIIALVLLTALAAGEWFFLVSFSKLPTYQGPAQAGMRIPAFQTTLADGRTFTDRD